MSHSLAARRSISSQAASWLVYFITYLFVLPGALHLLIQGELGLYFLKDSVPTLALGLFVLHFYICIRLATLSTGATAPILRFPFYAFVYVWVANVPLIQFHVGRLPWGVYLANDEYLYSLVVIAIGILFYELGAKTVRDKNPAATRPSPDFDAKRLQGAAALSILLVTLIFAVGGAGSLASSAGSEGFLRLIATALLRSPIVVCTFAFLFVAFTGRSRQIAGFQTIIVLLCGACLAANFPTTAPRSWVGGILLGLLALYSLGQAKNLYRFFGLPLICSFLFAFPLSPSFRRDGFDWERITSGYAYIGGDFDVFQMNAIIVSYAWENLQWGRQFLAPLLFWVPRSLWPAKPIGTGAFVAEETGMTFANVSAPLWSEAYINFGLLSVAILFFIYGRMSKRWEINLAQRHISLRLVVVASFLSGFQVFMLRGDLMTSATFLLPFLLFALFAIKPAEQLKRYV